MVWLSTTTCRPNMPRKRLPHYCTTRTLVAGGTPRLQNMQIWRRFANGEQRNTYGLSTSGTTKVCRAQAANGLHPLQYYTPSTALGHRLNNRVCHADTHMALKMVHVVRHTSTQSCLATHPPSMSPLWTHSSFRLSNPFFRMRFTVAAHTTGSFPFRWPPQNVHSHTYMLSLLAGPHLG